jgi:hypothetical protein
MNPVSKVTLPALPEQMEESAKGSGATRSTLSKLAKFGRDTSMVATTVVILKGRFTEYARSRGRTCARRSAPGTR